MSAPERVTTQTTTVAADAAPEERATVHNSTDWGLRSGVGANAEATTEEEVPQIITIESVAEEGHTVYQVIDPSMLPADVTIGLPPISVGTQTDLHIGRYDTVLVIPGQGGRLQLQ